MHLIKNIIILSVLLLLNACIKPFDPVIDTNSGNKYVVSGRVTDSAGWQEVEISMTSNVEKPAYIPVSSCQVAILDDLGNVFSLVEDIPGHYRVWMDQENLQAGTSFQVKIKTPDGDELLSGFDKMPKGPALDPVYYQIEDVPTTDPDKDSRIMQFYVDLNAGGDYSQFYMWEVYETWEYHAEHAAEFYYDGTFHQISPPDSSNLVCYMTSIVKEVFTISTKSLSQNSVKQYPLHAIDGRSSRLAILYSMLVRQLAMNEEAYNYWEQLRINSNNEGGLYEKQPLAIKGNIVNLTNPEKDVLGYFFAASESSERNFFKEVEGITLNYFTDCFVEGLGRGGWSEYKTNDFPVYYFFDYGSVRILSYDCVDCRVAGGKTEKPVFWPK